MNQSFLLNSSKILQSLSYLLSNFKKLLHEEREMQKKYELEEKNYYKIYNKFTELVKDKIENHKDLIRIIKNQLENKL